MKRTLLAILLLIAAQSLFAAEGDAQFGLGKATWRAGNYEKALEYFKQAADKGHAEAAYILGALYEEGRNVTADPATSAQWYLRAAELGHADAMNHIGNALRNGNGVAKNPAEAMKWYRKGAELGDAFGMENVADMLYDGIGVEKDLAQAAEWYRKAAEKGNRDAMLRYGYMLSHGQGVPLDTTKAFTWYLASARAGNNAAMFNIGEYYKNGKGVAQSLTAARFWYLRSAMAGETDAEAKVAELFNAPKESPEGAALFAKAESVRNSAKTNAEFAASKAKAFPIFLEAAELGHLPAVALMVYAYQDGDGTAKDPVKAREWAQIAAEMGNNAAANLLAQYMLKAIGGPRNTQGARFWFEKAALEGNSLASSFLAQIYDGNYGLPPNEALATYWWFEAFKQGSPTAEKVLMDRGLIEKQRDPVARAFVARIDKDGPDRSSVANFTFDVAQYCKYDGPRCHELSVAALKFQRDQNSAAEAANMARLWNSNNDPDADAKWRARSDCMQKKTESIQKHTYGQQDWYYSGSCY
ncbi:MAG TPA: hypothetical protein VF787_27810 [Thermoanaerobaculia bacterium]